MITFRDWYIFLGNAALLASSSLTAAQSLHSQLNPSTIAPGVHAVLEVRLTESADPNSDSPPPVYDDLLTQNPKFSVLEKSIRKEGGDWVWRYEITAYKAGKLVIPPIQIRNGSDTFSTESLPLSISSSRDEQDLELREEFGPIRRPIAWGYWIKLFLAAIVCLLAGVALKRWLDRAPWKRWKPKIRLSGRVTPREDDLVWLRRHLTELRKKIAQDGENDHLVDEWSSILRKYFARSTQLSVEGWTSQEFQRRLAKDPKAQPIVPLFKKCDEFKFTEKKVESPKHLTLFCLEQTEKALCGT